MYFKFMEHQKQNESFSKKELPSQSPDFTKLKQTQLNYPYLKQHHCYYIVNHSLKKVYSKHFKNEEARKYFEVKIPTDEKESVLILEWKEKNIIIPESFKDNEVYLNIINNFEKVLDEEIPLLTQALFSTRKGKR